MKTKQLFIIEYSSAIYAGAGECALVWAHDASEVEEIANEHMDTYYREQDADQYTEENDGAENEDVWYTVDRVLLLADHEHKDAIVPNSHYFPVLNNEE